jgi:hypothetical protein
MRLKEQLARLEKRVGAFPRDRVNTESIERNWRAWLYTLFGRIFTAQLASFHDEFWDWTGTRSQPSETGENFPTAMRSSPSGRAGSRSPRMRR